MVSILPFREDCYKITFRTKGGMKMYDYRDIVLCEANGRYTKILFINEDSILVSKHLKTIEYLLPDTNFFRVHKSVLVNVDYVVEIKSNTGTTLVLSNNNQVKVSVRRKPDLLKLLRSQTNII